MLKLSNLCGFSCYFMLFFFLFFVLLYCCSTSFLISVSSVVVLEFRFHFKLVMLCAHNFIFMFLVCVVLEWFAVQAIRADPRKSITIPNGQFAKKESICSSCWWWLRSFCCSMHRMASLNLKSPVANTNDKQITMNQPQKSCFHLVVFVCHCQDEQTWKISQMNSNCGKRVLCRLVLLPLVSVWHRKRFSFNR